MKLQDAFMIYVAPKNWKCNRLPVTDGEADHAASD